MCSTYPQTFQQNFSCLSTGLRRHEGVFSSTSNIVELAGCYGNSSASNLCGSTYPKSTNVSTPTLNNATPTLVSSSTSYLSRNVLSPFAPKSAWTKPRADYQCRLSLVQYPSSVFSGMPYYKFEVSFFMNYIDAPPQSPNNCKNNKIDSGNSSDEVAEIFDVVNEESSEDEQAGLVGVVKKTQCDISVNCEYDQLCHVDYSDEFFEQFNSPTIELSTIPICDESSECEQEISKPWYYDFDELVDIVNFLGSVDRVDFFGLGRTSMAPAEPVEIQALVSDVDSTLEPGLEEIEDDKYLTFEELLDIVHFLGLAPKSTPVRKLTWAEHLSIQKVVPKKEAPKKEALKNKTTILRKAVPTIVSVEVQVEAPPIVESKDSDYYFDLPFSLEDLDDLEDKCLSFDELVDIVQFLGFAPKSTSVQKINGAEHLSQRVETHVINSSDPWYYDFDELVEIVNFLGLVDQSDSFCTRVTCAPASVECHKPWYSDFDELVDIVHLLGFGPTQSDPTEITTPWYSDFDELVRIVHLLGFGPVQSESSEISTPWYSDFDELVDIVHLLGFGPVQSESAEITTPWYSDFDELVSIVHLLGMGPQLPSVPKKTWAEHLSVRKVPTVKVITSKKSTVLRKSLPKKVPDILPAETIVSTKGIPYKSPPAKISNKSNAKKNLFENKSFNKSILEDSVCKKPHVNRAPEETMIQMKTGQTLKQITWANHLATKRVSKVKYRRLK
ncbi:hypothetical protein CAAN1_08S00606 [[Candida] anglica]|uniref:Uncharacterized protein n=1 Tax=[Candida] anglica TaxID=148631 RepID=A0ABP0E661_9ASCO